MKNEIMDFEKFLVKVNTGGMCGGIQKLYRFENGYGASVIRNKYSYGGDEGLWELAMLIWHGDDEYDIYYCDITDDDVLGYLTDSQVNETLLKIMNYKFDEKIS